MPRKLLLLPLLLIIAALAAACTTQVVITPTAGPTQTPVFEEIQVSVTVTPVPFQDVPPTVFDKAIPQDIGYLVEEISDGLYYVTEGTYQMMFLTTGEGVIAVDAPPSIGQNILNAIASVTEEPITHVIYTHAHADHISGAGLYPAEATYIAHEETAATLERVNSGERVAPFGTFVGGAPVPAPTETFSDSFTLTVGTQRLELEYRGPAHEVGNIYVYAPGQKVLMLVDVVFPGWVPFKNLALAEEIPTFIAAHDEVLGYDFETFIGGHLTRLGTREDVVTQQDYVRDVERYAAQALQAVDFFEIAGDVGFENQWLLFDTYLDAMAKNCHLQVVEKWQLALAAADVFGEDHCFAMVESLRID